MYKKLRSNYLGDAVCWIPTRLWCDFTGTKSFVPWIEVSLRRGFHCSLIFLHTAAALSLSTEKPYGRKPPEMSFPLLASSAIRDELIKRSTATTPAKIITYNAISRMLQRLTNCVLVSIWTTIIVANHKWQNVYQKHQEQYAAFYS